MLTMTTTYSAPAPHKGKKPYKSWLKDGVSGGPCSMDILVRWLSVKANFAKWRGDENERTPKKLLLENILDTMRSHGIHHRLAKDIASKISTLQSNYRTAREWNDTEGKRLLDAGAEDETVHEELLKRFPYWDALHEAFGTRTSSWPMSISSIMHRVEEEQLEQRLLQQVRRQQTGNEEELDELEDDETALATDLIRNRLHSEDTHHQQRSKRRRRLSDSNLQTSTNSAPLLQQQQQKQQKHQRQQKHQKQQDQLPQEQQEQQLQVQQQQQQEYRQQLTNHHSNSYQEITSTHHQHHHHQHQQQHQHSSSTSSSPSSSSSAPIAGTSSSTALPMIIRPMPRAFCQPRHRSEPDIQHEHHLSLPLSPFATSPEHQHHLLAESLIQMTRQKEAGRMKRSQDMLDFLREKRLEREQLLMEKEKTRRIKAKAELVKNMVDAGFTKDEISEQLQHL
ncbi:unnamed protein product [Absidia cylindrospora]